MQQDACAICSIRQSCGKDAVTLHATEPILATLLSETLIAREVPHERRGQMFVLKEPSPARASIELIKARLSQAELRDVRVLLSSDPLQALRLEEWNQRADSEWFDRALVEDRFTTYFQPIVTTSGELFGHECLIRLQAERLYNGGEIVEAAQRRERVHAFDSYARRLGIRCAGKQMAPGKIFVNFMPSSIYDPEHCMQSTLAELASTHLRPTDVVFEVVESDQIASVAHLRRICEFYRREKFGFALDDVGTGSNSLQLMCDLQPEYIKLDKSLVSQIEAPMYRAIVEKIVEVAHQFGVQVIAEGIETAESARCLRELGADLLQGYFFGRPAPEMTRAGDLQRLSAALKAAEMPAPVFARQ